MPPRAAAAFVFAILLVPAIAAAQEEGTGYRVLATNKTSTMQKEMQLAAETGHRFVAVMGGETSFGGNEVVVLMQRTPGAKRYDYRLLATSKTSTLQRELQEASEAGFEYVGQTVFESTFGGQEVSILLERDPSSPRAKYEYKLVATKKTSTLQKELQEVGAQGYQALGMTVGETAMAGPELVVITRRLLR